MKLTEYDSAVMYSIMAWDEYCYENHIEDPFKTKTVHNMKEAHEAEKQGYIVEYPKPEFDYTINGKHMWTARLPFTDQEKKEYNEKEFKYRFYFILINYGVELAKEWESREIKDGSYGKFSFQKPMDIPYCVDGCGVCNMNCSYLQKGCCTVSGEILRNVYQELKEFNLGI